jgi:hypothetical protein
LLLDLKEERWRASRRSLLAFAVEALAPRA